MKQTYNVIGLMSGTSLDGLDIAHCSFRLENNKWFFEINQAETILYKKEMSAYLSSLFHVSGFELIEADRNYGNWLGIQVREFLSKYPLATDFVASHGHTIFHQPEKAFTFQLGHGPAIAATCGLPVISDFRSLDIALGGQGAPLVPIGDKLLFTEYGACLNLGGFANISFEENGIYRALDICPCNILLNEYAMVLGKSYDESGALAASGMCCEPLLKELKALPFYNLSGPKSLGHEWVTANMRPILDTYNLSAQDMLRTLVEHMATQITPYIARKTNVLVTGGGALNTFLCSRIQAIANTQLTIPNPQLIAYKEALVFAFLGVLNSRGETNTLLSVTGAEKDSCGGSFCNLSALLHI
jgi:anhydro-N-acetylmuramic acid kinase